MTTPLPAGLSSSEAASRLAAVGPNETMTARRRSMAAEVGLLLANPLVLVLLVASAVTAFLGEIVNASVIAVIVVVSVAIDFIQTYRSRRAAESLRDRVAPTATVLRDGAYRELPRHEIVPGDVIRLSAGDMVPADARLCESRDLHAQEAALTGESLPAEKGVESGAGDDLGSVFLGTSIVSGTAIAVVTATGSRTRFGDIAVRLAAPPPETAFEIGLRKFGYLIMRTVLFLVLSILALRVAQHRNALESLLFAVALAVGLTPEFLPMITSVTLAKGAVQMAKKHVIVKHLASMQNLGGIDILCSDKTGTLTSGVMALDRIVDLAGKPSARARELAALNAAFETGIKSPLDAAILASEKPDTTGVTKLDEVPFDFERRRLSVVVARGDERRIIVKGAPEGIFALSVAYDVVGGEAPLDAAARERFTAAFLAMCNEGLRVLAVASRVVGDQGAYSAADERDLVLHGLCAFADPPLDDCRDALADLAADGVVVKIVTGDNEHVAEHVCAAVGLDVSEVVLGDAIDGMDDVALSAVAERASVFARVSPAQKSRILLALKRRGHVVGFLGDGINDAPSLHVADVGISVSTAVDVARDAADVILMEHGLRVLHEGILEGRRAFGNVTKYLMMGTSSNFGNMFSMAGAALFLPFLPMLPMQILLNNLLYDVAQLTIPTDRVEDELVKKPQHWDIRHIRNFMLIIGPLSSIYDFVTFYVLLRVFHADPALFQTGWFVESLATQTLVIFVIRTMKNPLKSRPSLPLALTSLGVVALGTVLPFTPLGALLHFVPLPPMFFAFLVAVVVTYLLLVEVVKRALREKLGFALVTIEPPRRQKAPRTRFNSSALLTAWRLAFFADTPHANRSLRRRSRGCMSGSRAHSPAPALSRDLQMGPPCLRRNGERWMRTKRWPPSHTG